MAYPTLAQITESAPELATLTPEQRQALYLTSIASIEKFCGQSFAGTTTKAVDVQSVRSDVLYLPERLIELDAIVPYLGDPAELSAIARTHDGARLVWKKDTVGVGYYEQALQEISGYSYPTMFPDGWVTVAGTWGWEDSPAAIDIALRQDMIGSVTTEDNALTATVNYMREMGIDSISQGNLNLNLSQMPAMAPGVSELLEDYVFLGAPAGRLV